MSFRGFSLSTMCLTFFGMGWANAAMGPLLSSFAANVGLPLSQAGLTFTVAFFGGVLANLAGGPMSDRLGRGKVLLFSLLVGTVATFGLTLCRSLPVLLLFAFFSGVGGSGVILSASALVTDLFAERSVAALNLATLFFGIGAFTGPTMVSLSFGLWQTGMPALWLGIAVGLLFNVPLVAVVMRRIAAAEKPSAGLQVSAGTTPEASGAPASGSILRAPLLWVFGAVLLFDVGTEQTIGAWTTVYMTQSAALAIEQAALVVSGFWVTFTLGRLGAAGIGSRWSSGAVLFASLATGAAGILLVNLGTGSVFPSVLGFLLTGLGFGPLFPTVVALVGRTFGRNAGAAMGITMTLGSVGGMFMVWFEGALITGIGPAAGVRLFAFTFVAIAVLAVAARFLTRSAHAARPRAR